MGNEKAVVSIAAGDDSLAAARECIGERLADVIRRGDRVVLKVNQVGGLPAENGSTVRADLIGLVAEMARDAGAASVGIAEDAGRFNDTMRVFEAMGTLDAARRVGATIIDLRQHPHLRRPVPDGLLVDEIEYAAPLLDCDRLIGVAKIKTHHQAGITGALKNFFGAVPDDLKRRFHRMDLDKALVDMNSVRRADFTILDGFPAMEGVGPHQGTPVPLNATIAGADPVAVDATAASLMGFGPRWARHVQLAAEKGLGIGDRGRIEVQGVPAAAVARPFKTCLDQIRERLAGFVEVIDRTDCSGCACAVATTFMLLLGRHGRSPEELRGWRVFIGETGERPPVDDGRVLLVGDCTRGAEGHPGFISGCAPSISEIMRRISAADVSLTSFGPEVS